MNKRQMESLIKCGAFDSLNIRRSQLIAVYENIIDNIHKSRRNKVEGQISLFESGDMKQDMNSFSMPNLKEFDEKTKLAMEKEMLGIYISGHPLNEFEKEYNRMVSLTSVHIMEFMDEDSLDNKLIFDGSKVTVGGIILRKQNKITKNNNLMCFLTLEDFYGEIEVIVFPKILEKYKNIINEDNMVLVGGRLSFNEDEIPKLIAEKFTVLNKECKGTLYLRIGKKTNPGDAKKGIVDIVKKYKGMNNIVIHLEQKKENFRLSDDYNVDCMNRLMLVELKNLLGESNVVVR